MSKARFSILTIFIFALFIVLNCTSNKEPIGVLEVHFGSIVGFVKPTGTVALIQVMQGKTIKSTDSDSTTGYFEIKNLQVGFYTLDVRAEGYGRYVENDVQVVSDGITSVGDIYLKPVPEQILTVFPSNGSHNIELTTPCGFEFTTSMDHHSVEANFYISPQVNGYFRWEDNSTQSKIYFYPSLKYRAYTIYQISLGTGAKTIYGDTLSFAISSSFTTEPVQIEAHTPEEGESFVPPGISIYIKFNTPMDKKSVESAFKLAQSATGRFVWRNNESFTFTPDILLATNSNYTLTIATTAKDVYSTAMLYPFTLNFTTEPLTIKYNYPFDGSTHINRSTNIYVTFNTIVDQTAAEAAFSISPRVVGVFEWTDFSQFTFNPDVTLEPNTFYTITVNTNCRDIYNKYLLENYTFRFTTTN